MECDLCGKKGPTKLAHIEGSTFRVCTTCASLGQEIREVKPKKQYRRDVLDTEERVKMRTGSILREAREKRNMKQKDFARLLAVKESLLHSWESGHHLPTLEMAKRIGKKLGVSLVETGALERGESYEVSASSGGMTIGDMFEKN